MVLLISSCFALSDFGLCMCSRCCYSTRFFMSLWKGGTGSVWPRLTWQPQVLCWWGSVMAVIWNALCCLFISPRCGFTQGDNYAEVPPPSAFLLPAAACWVLCYHHPCPFAGTWRNISARHPRHPLLYSSFLKMLLLCSTWLCLVFCIICCETPTYGKGCSGYRPVAKWLEWFLLSLTVIILFA